MMALIWQNRNTDPACYKCYALKHVHLRLQLRAPCICVSLSFFWHRRKKYFLGTDTRGQNNKHKQGEAGIC